MKNDKKEMLDERALEEKMLKEFNVEELEERLEMKKGKPWLRLKSHDPANPNPDNAIIILGN